MEKFDTETKKEVEEEESKIKEHLYSAVTFLSLSFGAVLAVLLLIAINSTNTKAIRIDWLVQIILIIINGTLNTVFFFLGMSHLLRFFQELHKPTKAVVTITEAVN